jgi:hypothetical protein
MDESHLKFQMSPQLKTADGNYSEPGTLKPWHFYFYTYMKLNGTIPDGEVIFRDTIPGIGIFRNVKIQAPKYK